MAKIISIINQKGGVGKTTTAVNLSALMADMGQKVLLIDLDPQGNATSGLGMAVEDKSMYEVLMGRIQMKDLIEKTDFKNLSVAGSDIRLADAELQLVSVDKRESRLKTALAAVQKDFDFVLIDCPPSLSLLTVNALTASDSVIIPIQCEYYALEGVASLLQTIQKVKKTFNPRLDIEGVLLTMLDGRTNLGLQVVDEVKKHFKKQVYGTVIPRTIRLGEAPSHGEPIHIYDKRSTGTAAYAALAQEVLARNKVKVDKNWKL
ncbi:MAG: ParA family protein [Clostridia bacterium]|nr:ParA family protein [Clostridia bacterium]